ncbi:MAG TPA: glycosyltransferase family 87 protein [Vicinamibacterales bacterium]|nr:glycosyltransferase family 87 protein [Vicinamibacterales bacterium]
MAAQPRVNRWLMAAAWGATVVFLVAYTAMRSVGQTTNGFIAYYGAARLFVEGRLGAWVYDDARFMAFVKDLTHTSVLEIYGPNSPAMALLAVPFAGFGPDGARTAWLAASIAALVAAAAAVIADTWKREGELPAAVVPLVLVTPSVIANLHNGQAYLFVTALYAIAAVALLRGRDVLAGAALGLGFALKSAGLPLILLALVQKRFRVAASAGVVIVSAVMVVLSRSGLTMWRSYAAYVMNFVQRPSASVTASQTTYSLVRRLCVQDPRWNPFPAASCGAAAGVLPAALFVAALAITIWMARRAQAPDWLAAALCLCALDVPTAEDPHFAILGIPLVLLFGRWRRRATARWWPWAVYSVLMFVPMAVTARRFTEGWSALLAYPRLYAAWWLWGMAVKGL